MHPTRHLKRIIVALIVLWLVTAYFALPRLWEHKEKVQAMIAASSAPADSAPIVPKLPRHTTTGDSIPGDPINFVFVGTDSDIVKAMTAAGWAPADSITLKSSLAIAAATVLRHEYSRAPISPLYLWGKQQDLAFEASFGPDPKQRHHIRFWKSTDTTASGRPMWAAGATFDQAVGLSHDTEQITHHIAPGVDGERDNVIEDLRAVGAIGNFSWMDGFQKERTGKNGGGDPYFTDGRLAIIHLAQRP